MKRFVFALSALLMSSGAFAEELKVFPGSRLDEKAGAEASKAVPGKVSQVYITSESYEKVFAFYKGIYKQDLSMPSTGPKLPSGEQIQWAFFIIDGGTTLAKSNFWMKVQHPYVGGSDGKDVRDATVIQSVRKK